MKVEEDTIASQHWQHPYQHIRSDRGFVNTNRKRGDMEQKLYLHFFIYQTSQNFSFHSFVSIKESNITKDNYLLIYLLKSIF